ncbi:hypothetical protein V8J88_08015 [Massilia sp. W12]|uniref:hypothetical protein n=1 Tax=Massilia sp. W12 TaxID=3126507 RepID=UPI0030CDDD21
MRCKLGIGLALALNAALHTPALAGPGAHGPNGEHLDPPAHSASTSQAAPRLETFSEAYELTARLQHDAFSIWIDRYDSNAPVLQAKLEVEFNGRKLQAALQAAHGDYLIKDAQFLQALAKPGKHALLFTLENGEDSDLLEGVLEVNAPQSAPASGAPGLNWRSAGVAAALLSAGGAMLAARAWRRRRAGA